MKLFIDLPLVEQMAERHQPDLLLSAVEERHAVKNQSGKRLFIAYPTFTFFGAAPPALLYHYHNYYSWTTGEYLSSIESFSLSCPALMEINSSQACGINPTPYDAYDADSTDFTWTSSKPSVVSVSPSGVLTTNSAWGNSTISATHKTYTNLTSSAKVIVYVPMISFTIDGPTTMVVNSSACCCVVPNPCNAYYQENSFFTWTSDDESILTVDDEGYITSHSAGSCRITAAHKFYPNMTSSIDIIVADEYVPLTSFTIDCEHIMEINKTQTCSIVPDPFNASFVCNTDFFWKAADITDPDEEEIESPGFVSDDGVINSNQKTGIYEITATHKITGYTNFINIQVVDLSNGIGGEYYLNNKESGQFLTNISGTLIGDIYYGSDGQKWIFNYIQNGEFTIVSKSGNQVLYASGSSSVSVGSIPEDISSVYKWTVTAGKIKNVGCLDAYNNKKVLYNGTSSIGLAQELSDENDNYNRSVWRIVHTGSYRNLTDFSVASLNLNIGEVNTPSITTEPSGASWVSASDFVYATNDSYIRVS